MKFLRVLQALGAAAALAAAFSFPALAQGKDDGSAVDDVPRTVEFGLEGFAGYAGTEFFNAAHGGWGMAFRIRDVVTVRLRNQYFSASRNRERFGCRLQVLATGCPDEGTSFTGGLVLHPFKFYNGEIRDLWLEPYFASDVGVGFLFDKRDGAQFLAADFLWGLNFDIGREMVVFFEGGILYLDFDDKDWQKDSVTQGEMQGGVRFFF